MKYTVVSSSEFTYPDIFSYPSSRSSIDVFSARGSYATWQILFSDRTDNHISVSFRNLPQGTEAEIYTLHAVKVERNQNMDPNQFKPHYPERIAPYYLYDCLRTFDGTLDLSNGQGGLYVSIRVDHDAIPAVYSCAMIVDGEEIPMSLEIFAVTLPEETLTMINKYSPSNTIKYHNLAPDSPAYYDMEARYLQLLRRMHQNTMYTSRVKWIKDGEHHYSFDFSHFIQEVERYEKSGMRSFIAPSVGGRISWNQSTIVLQDGTPAMSYEGYCILMDYLPALKKVLDDHGWTDRFVMNVSDEPNDANCTEYRALCGLIHRIVPDIRLCDAMSYCNIHGALDVWVPLNSEYDKHRSQIETFRQGNSEIWHYVCCVPREPDYINRFMDYPLLSTRYLHWGNYKYNLTGYLHWAANSYQPGQDPFECNCPEHHNADSVCFLPAGDTHIIYPGKDGPWMSIRLEAQRESAEDYEFLRKLALKDKEKADALCDRVFRSFKDVNYDVNTFTSIKRELLKTLS